MPQSVNDRLVDAINRQQLRPTLAQLSASTEEFSSAERAQVDDAAAAIEAMDAAVDHEIARLTELLETKGVTARSIAPAAPDRAIYAIALTVGSESLETTATTLEAAGYRSEHRGDQPLWLRYATFYDTTTFLADDEFEFRVQLGWERPSGLVTKIPQQLRPSMDDLTSVALPAVLTPAYALVKPVRQVLGKRQASPTDLGPFLGTPTGLIPHLLDFSGIEAGQQLIDLGCGDGRVLIDAAARHGCEAVGYETDPALVARGRATVAASDSTDVRNHVTLQEVDARDADVSEADVVFIFLPITALQNLVPAVLKRMKPGAALIAHEQEQLKTSVTPLEQRAMVHRDGVTVAHRWVVDSWSDESVQSA